MIGVSEATISLGSKQNEGISGFNLIIEIIYRLDSGIYEKYFP